MRYKKVNTEIDIDNMTTQEMIAHMSRKFVVRVKETGEWVTGSHVNTTNQNKAKTFDSYSDAMDEVLRLRKSEYLDAEIFQTY